MNRRRVLTLAALPVVMGGAVVGGQAALASTTQPSKPAQTCILGLICLGGGSSSSASPSPTYTLPTCLPTALPTSLPTTLPTSILKKLEALPQCLVSALPQKLPVVSVPTSLPTIPGLPTSLPTAGGLPTSLPGGLSTAPGQGGSGGSGKGKSSGKDPKEKNTTGGYGLVAPTATSVLSGDSATLVDFKYAGNAKVLTAAGGTVTMMKFTASSLTLSGHAQDVVTEDGVTATTSSPNFLLNGNVVLYATKLSGKLAGIPLTFTPTTISKLLLTAASVLTKHTTITMTSVITDQALATADSLTYEPGFSVSLS